MVLNVLLTVNTLNECFVFDFSQGEANVRALNIETPGVITHPLALKKRGSRRSDASTVGAKHKTLECRGGCVSSLPQEECSTVVGLVWNRQRVGVNRHCCCSELLASQLDTS